MAQSDLKEANLLHLL